MTMYGRGGADRGRLLAAAALQRRRFGYQLASIIAGGPSPFIATALFAAYGSGYMVAVYILACCVISIVCVSLLQDHTNKDLAVAHEGI